MRSLWVRGPVVVAVVTLGWACSGDGGGGPMDPPPGDEPVATVTVTAPTGPFVPGQSFQLTVILRDASGEELTGRTVEWSSSNEAVAQVSATGEVTTVSAGRATVTAASENRTGMATLDVQEGGLVGPAGGTVTALGGTVELMVPAGALAAETAILVTGGGALPLDPSLVADSRVALAPAGTAFAVPAQLRIPYDPAQGPSGADEADFRLHRIQNPLLSLGGTVDAAANRVSASVSQLGTFGVGRAQPAEPCTAPEHRQFDFWLGEWTIIVAGSQQTPPSDITLEPGGCAVFENFNNGAGRSINVFNEVDQMWHQTFIFASGQRLILVGELVGEEMILAAPDPFGPPGSFNRWTWTPNADGTVRQLQEQSIDGGATVGGFDGLYVPR